MCSSVPISPPSTMARARLATGWSRGCMASTAMQPLSSEARWTAMASAALFVKGFSHSTLRARPPLGELPQGERGG